MRRAVFIALFAASLTGCSEEVPRIHLPATSYASMMLVVEGRDDGRRLEVRAAPVGEDVSFAWTLAYPASEVTLHVAYFTQTLEALGLEEGRVELASEDQPRRRLEPDRVERAEEDDSGAYTWVRFDDLEPIYVPLDGTCPLVEIQRDFHLGTEGDFLVWATIDEDRVLFVTGDDEDLEGVALELVAFDGTTATKLTASATVGYVSAAHREPEGDLWLGNRSGDVMRVRIDGATLEVLERRPLPCDGEVTGLAGDGDDLFAVTEIAGSQPGCFAHFNGGAWTTLVANSGLQGEALVLRTAPQTAIAVSYGPTTLRWERGAQTQIDLLGPFRTLYDAGELGVFGARVEDTGVFQRFMDGRWTAVAVQDCTVRSFARAGDGFYLGMNRTLARWAPTLRDGDGAPAEFDTCVPGFGVSSNDIEFIFVREGGEVWIGGPQDDKKGDALIHVIQENSEQHAPFGGPADQCLVGSQ
ncbi:MAG: hypothetical protein RIT81_21640 [Deltaproteobacteria bacterium]